MIAGAGLSSGRPLSVAAAAGTRDYDKLDESVLGRLCFGSCRRSVPYGPSHTFDLPLAEKFEQAEEFHGAARVSLNLRLEGCRAGEFYFVAQPMQEPDLHFTAVDLT